MRWRLKEAIAAVAALLLCGQALAIEVALEYYRYPSESEQQAGQTDFQPFGGTSAKKLKEPPPGEWKLPELKAAVPVYALVPLGDRDHLMVLDMAEDGAAFYDRLYFDANANRDLTDDSAAKKSVNVDSSSNMGYVVFGAVDAEVSLGDKTLPYRFQPMVYCFYTDPSKKDLMQEENWQNLYLQIQVKCAYRGDFKVDGASYSVTLVDQNLNGRFDETYSDEQVAVSSGGAIYPMGDRIYLAQDEALEYYDGLVLCKHLYLGGMVYDVSVDLPGGKLTLARRTEGLGTLVLPPEIQRVTLEGKAGGASLAAYKPNGKIRVPAGDYRLLSYQRYRTEEKGDRWRLMAGGTRDAAFLSVGADQEATLRLGEPYTPVVQMPEYFREMLQSDNRIEEAYIEFLVRGAGDEVVTELARVSGKRSDIEMSTRSTSQPKEPTYKVIQGDGEVVAQGSFEYG